jgi:hypothetical protein
MFTKSLQFGKNESLQFVYNLFTKNLQSSHFIKIPRLMVVTMKKITRLARA